MKKDYVAILQIVGDAYLKLDYIYEAERFFLKALDIDPKNPVLLLKTKKCYERLNNELKVRDIEERLAGIITPREQTLPEVPVPKGGSYPIPFILEGGGIRLEAAFSGVESTGGTLVGYDFNGRVLWEGPAGKAYPLKADAEPGQNTLVIRAISGPLAVSGIKWAPYVPQGASREGSF
jgi:tetratricopeptide (TPR) repeat protein